MPSFRPGLETSDENSENFQSQSHPSPIENLKYQSQSHPSPITNPIINGNRIQILITTGDLESLISLEGKLSLGDKMHIFFPYGIGSYILNCKIGFQVEICSVKICYQNTLNGILFCSFYPQFQSYFCLFNISNISQQTIRYYK
jgi:hypothetical protein